MKIIHLSHTYHPSEGGVQSFFKNVSEILVAKYGDDVTVVTTDSMYGPERKIYKKSGPPEEMINGVRVLRFSFERWHIKPLNILFRILKRLKIKIPEQLILHGYGPRSSAMKQYLMQVTADVFCGSSTNYFYMRLPLWRKCKFAFFGSTHLHEDETIQTLLPTQIKAIKASTIYLANTNFEKKRIAKLGVNAQNIYVLGVGVNMQDFNHQPEAVDAYRLQLELDQDSVLIGYVGRIERTKNVKILVEAFELVARESPLVHLLIAGSGDAHVLELKQMISQFEPSITSRIHWDVKFPYHRKPIIFNALDVFVLPSNNESFGIVFLEAWSCKKPVIGAAIGAVKDVISDKIDGLLMRPDEYKSLAAQINILVEDKSLRMQFGENGYQKVYKNFTWDIITARLRKLYENDLLVTDSQPLKQVKSV